MNIFNKQLKILIKSASGNFLGTRDTFESHFIFLEHMGEKWNHCSEHLMLKITHINGKINIKSVNI